MEIKALTYVAIGLLLFIRTIINKSIFNNKNKANFSAYKSLQGNHELIDYFKTAFIFWVKPEKENQTKARDKQFYVSFCNSFVYLYTIKLE